MILPTINSKKSQPTETIHQSELHELQHTGCATIVSIDRLAAISPRHHIFQTVERCWRGLTASFALDLVWVPYFADLEQHASIQLLLLPWILIILASVGLSPNFMFALSERFQRLQSEVLTRYGRRLLPIMLGLLPFLALLEITARSGLATWAALLIAAFGSIPIAYNFAPKLRSHLEGRLRLPRNRFVRLNALEQRALIIGIAPLACARAISIAAAIVERSSLQFIANWQPWFAISVLMLVLLRPSREDWVWRCPHCGAETPRGLGKMRYCLACAPHRFRTIRPERV